MSAEIELFQTLLVKYQRPVQVVVDTHAVADFGYDYVENITIVDVMSTDSVASVRSKIWAAIDLDEEEDDDDELVLTLDFADGEEWILPACIKQVWKLTATVGMTVKAGAAHELVKKARKEEEEEEAYVEAAREKYRRSRS
jgi:hypothetical protein